MIATYSSSANQPYGVARVCRAWEVPRSTFYDWRKRRSLGAPRGRRGPKPAVPDDELARRIRGIHAEVGEQHGIRGEGYRETHARLRMHGVPANKHRVNRVVRESVLLSPTRVGSPRGPRVHDGHITTDVPSTMWGTDATTCKTIEDGAVWIFAAVDHCSGDVVGSHASVSGTRYEALEPIRQGVRVHCGGCAARAAVGLALRHDHGTQYTSRVFQDELRFLGIESSHGFVRSPEGNRVAECFFRTLKEQLLWVRTFRSVEELRLALLDFQRT